MPTRCGWVPDGDEAYLAYHDEEWGVPVHDERRLFEMLTLEGAQAGLSWSTILRKRDGYRAAFAGFDPEAVARFTPARIERLLARSVDRAQPREGHLNRREREGGPRDPRGAGSLDALLWSFVGGEPIVHRYRRLGDVPAETPESRAMSKELKGAASASSARRFATPSCRRAVS